MKQAQYARQLIYDGKRNAVQKIYVFLKEKIELKAYEWYETSLAIDGQDIDNGVEVVITEEIMGGVIKRLEKEGFLVSKIPLDSGWHGWRMYISWDEDE